MWWWVIPSTGVLVKWNTHQGQHPGYLMYSAPRQNAYETAVAINEKHMRRSRAAREVGDPTHAVPTMLGRHGWAGGGAVTVCIAGGVQEG